MVLIVYQIAKLIHEKRRDGVDRVSNSEVDTRKTVGGHERVSNSEVDTRKTNSSFQSLLIKRRDGKRSLRYLHMPPRR